MPFEERPIDIATGSSVLLVLPPFLGIDRPYLGLHTLQACARRAGFEVGITRLATSTARRAPDAYARNTGERR